MAQAPLHAISRKMLQPQTIHFALRTAVDTSSSLAYELACNKWNFYSFCCSLPVMTKVALRPEEKLKAGPGRFMRGEEEGWGQPWVVLQQGG